MYHFICRCFVLVLVLALGFSFLLCSHVQTGFSQSVVQYDHGDHDMWTDERAMQAARDFNPFGGARGYGTMGQGSGALWSTSYVDPFSGSKGYGTTGYLSYSEQPLNNFNMFGLFNQQSTSNALMYTQGIVPVPFDGSTSRVLDIFRPNSTMGTTTQHYNTNYFSPLLSGGFEAGQVSGEGNYHRDWTELYSQPYTTPVFRRPYTLNDMTYPIFPASIGIDAAQSSYGHGYGRDSDWLGGTGLCSTPGAWCISNMPY